eukprot:931639-Rhodomonas_salina.1
MPVKNALVACVWACGERERGGPGLGWAGLRCEGGSPSDGEADSDQLKSKPKKDLQVPHPASTLRLCASSPRLLRLFTSALAPLRRTDRAPSSPTVAPALLCQALTCVCSRVCVLCPQRGHAADAVAGARGRDDRVCEAPRRLLCYAGQARPGVQDCICVGVRRRALCVVAVHP